MRCWPSTIGMGIYTWVYIYIFKLYDIGELPSWTLWKTESQPMGKGFPLLKHDKSTEPALPTNGSWVKLQTLGNSFVFSGFRISKYKYMTSYTS